jgi:hypothetical protein
MTAKCRICELVLESNIVGNEQIKANALGELMMAHVGNVHLEFAQNLVFLNKVFNGFLMMNQFKLDDKQTIDEMERMRSALCEEIMKDSPENEEDVLEVNESDDDNFTIECPNCGEEFDLDIEELLEELDEEDNNNEDNEENEKDIKVITVDSIKLN